MADDAERRQGSRATVTFQEVERPQAVLHDAASHARCELLLCKMLTQSADLSISDRRTITFRTVYSCITVSGSEKLSRA